MRVSAALALSALLAVPAFAQQPPPPLRDPLAPASSTAASDYDPRSWWQNPERRVEDRYDPLGNRRWGRRDRPLTLERAPDASLYRLWGLTPLQTQTVRRGDTVLEAWVRPTAQRPEVVVRVTVRSDGRVFAQGRAGFACCRPDISRRVNVDVELPRETRDSFLALRDDPLWSQPEHVVAQEEGAVSSLCVDGISYDLYLAQEGRAAHRRRSCDDAEVGSAANVLQALFNAVRGHEPRLEAAVPQNGNFEAEKTYWAQFAASGGRLVADTTSGQAEPPPPPPAEAEEADPRAVAVREIMAADFAYAARAGEAGAGQAAADTLDPTDGLLFRRGADPVRGRTAVFEALGGGLPQTGRWIWGPVAGFASEQGDMGATWGRWNFTPVVTGAPPAGGRYMTVWRRDESGRWRGLMTMNDGDDGQPPNPPPSR